MKFRIKLLMFFLPVLLIGGFSYGQVIPSSGKWIEGKRYIPYKIKAKDTWTNLALRFESTVKDLQNINKGVADLKIGQVIYLPTKPEKTGDVINIPDKGEKQSVKKETLVYHTVKKQETLYHISKVYHQSIDNIMKWNNLTSNNISIGAQLIVSKNGKVPEGVSLKTQGEVNDNTSKVPVENEVKKAPANETPKTDVVTHAEQEKIHKAETVNNADVKAIDSLGPSYNKETSSAIDKITETGVATWFNDQELNQNKFYALHRIAPIGTIIKVTNRMNNNSVFVKVVGVLPGTGDNDNVIIKITSAAAQRIGAIDQKFTAELSYGITK